LTTHFDFIEDLRDFLRGKADYSEKKLPLKIRCQ